MAGQGAGMSRTGPPSEPPRDYAGPFAIERDRLTELLAGLQAADWDRPSPCPGWTVLGLCCHLVGDDLGLLARNRDGFLGTRAPAGSEAEFAAWLDELQAEWVRAARRLSPRLVTDLLRWAGPQINVMFAGEDARARTASVSWAGPDLVPAWLGQARELSEYWIHRQQVLQALGRPSDLRADLAGPVLDALRWAYPYRLAQAAARPGDTVSISVTGPLARTWHLVAAEIGWQFGDQPGPRLVGSLAMNAEQAWRLLTNNMPAAGQGALTVSGDDAITAILLRTRATCWPPGGASVTWPPSSRLPRARCSPSGPPPKPSPPPRSAPWSMTACSTGSDRSAIRPEIQLHDPVVSDRLTVVDLLSHRSGLPRHEMTWLGHPGRSRPELVRPRRFLLLSRTCARPSSTATSATWRRVTPSRCSPARRGRTTCATGC